MRKRNSGKKRILLVDGSDLVRICLIDYLERAGFEAAGTDSGEGAVALLPAFEPHVIVLDIMIGGMGGLGFMKKISGADGRPRYPVLIFTERQGIENFARAVNAAGYLHKSTSGEELLAHILEIVDESETAARRLKNATRKKRLVMLAEDDPRVAKIIRTAFAEAGYLITVIPSGLDLPKKAEEEEPDIIILKEMLTGMNGHLAAERFKGEPGIHGVPVILYDQTREGQDEDEPCFKVPSNVQKYLTTFDPLALVSAVREVLS